MPGTKIALEETRDETTEATDGARHALGSPAYPVVQCISAGLGPGLGVMGVQGKCGITERFELVLPRESDNANDLWGGRPHPNLDIILLDEFDRLARPWLTSILDDKSRAVAGHTTFLSDPSALRTALALRQAIWRNPEPAWPVCGHCHRRRFAWFHKVGASHGLRRRGGSRGEQGAEVSVDADSAGGLSRRYRERRYRPNCAPSITVRDRR